MLAPFFWIVIFQYSQEKMVDNFMKTIGSQPVNLAFENLTIKTMRDNQKAINLTSPNAKIYDLKISRIDLQKPTVTLSEINQTSKLLFADMGYYQQDNQTVTLSDNVKLTENGTFKVTADKMLVDLNNFKITLPNGVNALYKNNSLKAKDVEFQQKTNRAIFKGGVKLVIQPNPS
jgi:LPS export ABC transporter protein LptC